MQGLCGKLYTSILVAVNLLIKPLSHPKFISTVNSLINSITMKMHPTEAVARGHLHWPTAQKNKEKL